MHVKRKEIITKASFVYYDLFTFAFDLNNVCKMCDFGFEFHCRYVSIYIPIEFKRCKIYKKLLAYNNSA